MDRDADSTTFLRPSDENRPLARLAPVPGQRPPDSFPWTAALIAAIIPLAHFAWQRNIGLSLWDEGFLWYGAQRVLAGEVPLRDFHAYDIGRYYFSATIMAVLNDAGIVALRASNAIVQAIAVALGTYLLARRARGLLFPLLSAVSLFIWMHFDFKATDYLAAIVLMAAFVLVIETPRMERFFACGALIGLVAILGRNHGVYGVIGSVLLFLYVFLPNRGNGSGRAFAAWSAGVIAGYAPMLVMIASTPGLPMAFLDSVLFLFEYGATNIALPLPRPWWVRVQEHGLIPLLVAFQQIAIALLIPTLPAFGVVALATMLIRRVLGKELDSLFVASACLALPYSHYTLSRADLAHLTFGILPFLIAILSFPLLTPRMRSIVALTVLAISIVVIVPDRPGFHEVRDGGWQTIQVLGDHLRIDRYTEEEIRLLERLVERYAPGDTSFLAAPFWPGAYAAFNKRSPMWDIYPLVARSERAQIAEIERIRYVDPGFVVISDKALDGRDALRFRNTQPLIETFIRAHFVPVIDPGIPSYLRVYRRRG